MEEENQLVLDMAVCNKKADDSTRGRKRQEIYDYGMKNKGVGFKITCYFMINRLKPQGFDFFEARGILQKNLIFHFKFVAAQVEFLER